MRKWLIQHEGFTEIPNDMLPNMFDIMNFTEVAKGFSIQISNNKIDSNKPWATFITFSDMLNGAASFDIEDNEADLYLVINYWSADEEDNGMNTTVKFALSEIQNFIWKNYQDNSLHIVFQYLDYCIAIYCKNLLY